MTFKLAVNDANEHLEMNATPASWMPTGRAPDALTPYFSTSVSDMPDPQIALCDRRLQDRTINRATTPLTRQIRHYYCCLFAYAKLSI